MMKSRAKSVRLFIAFFMIFNCMPMASSQTPVSGAVEGSVFVEGTSQGIPNANVVVRNQDTGVVRATTTDAQGRYFIGALPPGWYRISATASGYEQGTNSVVEGFTITIKETKTVRPPPIALRRAGTTQPRPSGPTGQTQAGQSQTVQQGPSGLPAAAPEGEQIVNTTNASRGQSFDRRQVITLPLPGVRTFDDLAFLAPGVVPPPFAIGTAVGPGIGPGVGTSGQFSVNGLRSRSNNFTIDGADNNDEEVGVRRQGFTSLVPQSIESIQEFNITTLLAEPQYGRGAGAQVDAVSRSGGELYNGSIYGFFTNKALRARDVFDLKGGPANFPITRSTDGAQVFFNNQPLAPTNPVGGENDFTRSQFGFVLGGPIVKQRTHFFASAEHQDIDAERESHFAVPRVEERGLFLTGDIGFPFLGGLFPASGAGNSFFGLFPFPNNPLGPYGDNTFTEILPASARGTIFSFKLDQQAIRAFGEEHNFTARYNFTDDNTILPVTGEALFSSLRALVRTQNLSLFLDTVISPKTTNQLRGSYGRTRLKFREVRNPFLVPSDIFPDTPFLLNARSIFNITLPGRRPDLLFAPFNTEFVTGPVGQVIISGFSPVGVDVFNFPQARTNNTFQFADTLIVNLTRHRITAGFDIRRNQLNSRQDRNFRPLAVFNGAFDFSGLFRRSGIDFSKEFVNVGSIPGVFLGKDFAALAAPTGFFQTQTTSAIADSTIGLRYWQTNFFLSDQIRIRPNFVLTLGARYELNTVPTEVNDRIESTFNSPEVRGFQDLERTVSTQLGLPAESGLERFLAGRTKIFERDNNNIAPHIAFAWSPGGNGRTSVRGGYGIYYDQIPGAIISQSRNVFPTFLTINLGGLGFTFDERANLFELAPVNPAILSVPGKLNTLNVEGLRALGLGNNVVELARSLGDATNFSAGVGFVLPAADLVSPYAQHWGLTLERALTRDLLLSAGYVGTKGVHLLRLATPNLGPNGVPVLVDIREVIVNNVGTKSPVGFGFTVSPARLNPSQPNRRLRPFPLLGSFTSIESDANSIYHGLQAQLNKRFSRGVQFTTAYTWSHAIDEVSDLFDLAGARALPQDSFNRRAERGDANFDVRHRFTYSFIWDLPGFEGKGFFDGWQLASIGTFQTGQPYSVLFCCDINADGNLTDRVDPGFRNVGTASRNPFRAPDIATVDMTVNKFFRFSERRNLQFRTEVFNLFNRSNFGIPINQLFFGGESINIRPATEKIFVDTRVPKRTIQFALKYNF